MANDVIPDFQAAIGPKARRTAGLGTILFRVAMAALLLALVVSVVGGATLALSSSARYWAGNAFSRWWMDRTLLDATAAGADAGNLEFYLLPRTAVPEAKSLGWVPNGMYPDWSMHKATMELPALSTFQPEAIVHVQTGDRVSDLRSRLRDKLRDGGLSRVLVDFRSFPLTGARVLLGVMATIFEAAPRQAILTVRIAGDHFGGAVVTGPASAVLAGIDDLERRQKEMDAILQNEMTRRAHPR